MSSLNQGTNNAKSTPNLHDIRLFQSGRQLTHNKYYSLDATSISSNSTTVYTKTTSDNTTYSQTGDYLVETGNGTITITSGNTTANALVIAAANTTGGVIIESGTGGLTLSTTGALSITSNDGNVSIGSSTTDNVDITANEAINFTADTITGIATNDITWRSINGEVILDTSGNSANSALRAVNSGEIVLNADQLTTSEFQLEVNVGTGSNIDSARNGILLNSTNSNIAPEYRLLYTNSAGSKSVINTMGVYPETSTVAKYREYVGYQYGNQLIVVDGPVFQDSDVGKKVVFKQDSRTSNITGIGTIITPATSTYSNSALTVGGVYTGVESLLFKVEIDGLSNVGIGKVCDTFRWSSDGGQLFTEEYVPINYGIGQRYPLQDGVYVEFNSNTGHALYDFWSFQAKRTAIVDSNIVITGSITNTEAAGNVVVEVVNNSPVISTSNTLGAPVFSNISGTMALSRMQKFITTSPFQGYIGTVTNNDLIFKTADTERFRITADGSLGTSQEGMDARLRLVSNYNGPILVNDNIVSTGIISETTNISVNVLGYQLNPVSTELNTGGYIIAYESQDQTESSATRKYDIYADYFTANGNKIGNGAPFRVNITQVNEQSHPAICKSGTLDSDNFLIVWACQDADDTDVYQIRGNIFENGTDKVFANNDMLIASATTNIKLTPRCCGLTNGNYVIVYVSLEDDDSNGSTTENYHVKYIIIDATGNVVKTSTQLTTDVGDLNYIYPVVAGLSNKDPYYPGGFVVAYMKQVYTSDPRYQLVYKVLNAAASTVTDERTITTTAVSTAAELFGNSEISLSDSLPSVVGLSDIQARSTGGFLVAYQTNYSASVNYATVASAAVRNITGVSSTAEANLIDANINGTTGIQTIIVNSVNGTFLAGEQIYLVGDDGYLVEKIATATVDGSNVNIVLSRDPKNIRLAKYSTVNLSNSSYDNLLWRKNINSTNLVLDIERQALNSSNSSPTDFTRTDSLFYAYRGRVALQHDNSNRAAIGWQSGAEPNVYYQQVNISDGTTVGDEELIAESQIGLRQTDPDLAQLRNQDGDQLGYVVAFSSSSMDHSQTAIYQQLIASPTSYLLHLNNKTAELVCDNNAQLGIGTKTPDASLHIKTLASQNTTLVDTASLIMQNSSTTIDTLNDRQRISFKTGGGTELARIKVHYSNRYQDMYPKAENLISYYKFDESQGSLIALDSGLYNIQSGSSNLNVNNNNQNALLVNFDVNKCWKTGKINNALLFDGENDHLKIPQESVSAASIDRLTNSTDGFSISGWFNIAESIFTDTRMDILSFGTDDVGTASGGAIQLYLQDTLSIGVLYPHIRFTLDGTNTANVLQVRPSDLSRCINTGDYRHLVITYDASNTEFKTYLDNVELTTWLLDGDSAANANIGGSLENIEADLDTYIGSNISGSGNYYRGYMDELRFYNTPLTTTDIARLYKYGSEERAQLVIQTRGDTTDFDDAISGLILNDRGRLAGLGIDGNIFKQLTGTIIVQSGSTTTLTGEDTLFTKEVKTGDVLYIDNKSSDLELSNDEAVQQRLYTVVSIASDTSLTINRAIPDVTTTRYFSYVTIRPSILSATDLEETQQLMLDYNGDLVLGSGKSANNATKLEIRGTGLTSASKSGLTLTNTATTGTAAEDGRSNKIIFRASNGSAIDSIQSLINVSHSGTSENSNTSKMRFLLNNGTAGSNITTDLTHAMTIFPSSKLSIGQEITESQILGDFHIRGQDDTPATIALFSEENATGALTERSHITWYGTDSYTSNTSGLTRIQGANDKYVNSQESVANGRIDISLANYSSTDERALGLIPRLSFTAQGRVGIHTQRPTTILSVSPKFIKSDSSTVVGATVAVNSDSTVEFDTELFSNNINTQLLRAGSFVINHAGNVSAYAISPTAPRIDNSNLQLYDASALSSLDLTGLAGNASAGFSIHYPGLYVNNKGLVGIGDSRFDDSADTAYHLAVSGNTTVKGKLDLMQNISNTSTTVSIKSNTSDQLVISDAATVGEFVRVFGGPSMSSIITTTINYDILWTDSTILANGAITITLPEPVSARNGQSFTIKNISSSTVTIGRNGSGITIDGAASDLSITVQYASVSVQTDGSNWWVIGEYNP